MNGSAEIAARFDDRPGFALVDFEEVGLPVYRLTAVVLTMQPKAFPPIEEFILKCIGAGLTTPNEIGGLLGIDIRVVEAGLSILIQDDAVYPERSGKVALTQKSKALLAGEAMIKPREQMVTFHFDGLLRRPRYLDPRILLAPVYLRRAGIREIRAFPAKRPEAHDIDVRRLDEALRLAAGTSRAANQILRVREIRRKENSYVPAVALIYRSKSSADIRVGFAVDGRVSEDHERAFLAAGGPEKLGIEAAIREGNPKPDLKEVLGKSIADELTNLGADEESVRKLRVRSAVARFKADLARESATAEPTEVVSDGVIAPEIDQALEEVRKTDEELKRLKVRPIAVYEHPKLLYDAMVTASSRILIISPWITPAVVDDNFIRMLRAALGRGVKVLIGYGLSRDEKSKSTNEAEEKLQKIVKESENFRFVYLGNTHAKILIKDQEFFVVSSFNWLSFRGDPKRTFREEWGTFVGIPALVDQYFNELSKRFAHD